VFPTSATRRQGREMIGDLIALGARRCVVPQLGWTDNPVLLVENDKTVLFGH